MGDCQRSQEPKASLYRQFGFECSGFGGPYFDRTVVKRHQHIAISREKRAFAFETGYVPPKDDPRWQEIQQQFASNHYDVLELLRAIALSDLSYSPSAPKVLSAANH